VLAKFLKTTPGFHQFCCSTEEVRAALAAAKVFSFVSGQREREKAALKDSSFCCIFSPILEGWVRGDVAGQKREKKSSETIPEENGGCNSSGFK
jgi:hypothetical protein